MTGGRYTSDLAEALAPDALERFLRYVRIDTQSDPGSTTYPSTAKQLDLSRLLVEELRELGLDDARLDDHGYVTATLPATVEGTAPAIGLLAHVDTSPSVSGENVQPHVHRSWDGNPIMLPGDQSQVLDPAEMTLLADHRGCDLVTSDGTTLLGADDKAGVAEIMAAVAYLAAHPEIPHGPVKVAFTPDEEIGKGVEHFDLERFGAVAAYTLDGSTAGEMQDETFSAAAVTITFRGREVHPGLAKDVMVNSIKAAARMVASLPVDTLSPETTEQREGYVHPNRLDGHVARTTMQFIVRDFDDERLRQHEALLRRLAEEAAASVPGCSVDVEIEQTYENMRNYLRDHPRVVEAAEEAIRREGLEPKRNEIRGGTDGSLLSAKGLPTPNIFTGGHEFHSEREWACVQDMGAACATLVHLVQIWAEDGADSAQRGPEET